MPTSPADPSPGTLLAFLGEGGAFGRWLLLDEGGVAAEGVARDGLPESPVRAVLAVPGDQLTLHWIELAEGLAPAQAAAAARLMLADASAEPLSTMHVAVGRPERGLTPVALVPSDRMALWLAVAEAAGLDPDLVIPAPLLLAPPEAGFVRRDLDGLADYRGPAAAFTVEPELAELLVDGAPVEAVDEARFQAGLAPILASSPLDLRQGPFLRRRQWKLEGQRLRRVGMFALALVVLTLVVQVATILSYTFAADRLQAEADALAAAGGRADTRPGFGAAAAILFDAVRATPNVEVSRIEYRPDGSLGATLMLDNPATLTALEARIEASGLAVEPGERRNAGGRPSADLVVGPA
jgi:general secretion pathway protein L